MVLGDDWQEKIMGPLVDVVPPAKSKGDPLPPESMKLREELIRKHEDKMRAKREAEEVTAGTVVVVPCLPIDPEGERRIDALLVSRKGERRPRPIYKDVLVRALRLHGDERLALMSALIGSLELKPDPDSDEGSQ